MITIDARRRKIAYDSKIPLKYSHATDTGGVIVGVKDRPSQNAINETIEHERCHLTTRPIKAKPYSQVRPLERCSRELDAYAKEKSRNTARWWNSVLPIRIRDFKNYVSWESKKEQIITRKRAETILSPRPGGGNEEAVARAMRGLSRFWLPGTKPKISGNR